MRFPKTKITFLINHLRSISRLCSSSRSHSSGQHHHTQRNSSMRPNKASWMWRTNNTIRLTPHHLVFRCKGSHRFLHHTCNTNSHHPRFHLAIIAIHPKRRTLSRNPLLSIQLPSHLHRVSRSHQTHHGPIPLRHPAPRSIPLAIMYTLRHSRPSNRRCRHRDSSHNKLPLLRPFNHTFRNHSHKHSWHTLCNRPSKDTRRRRIHMPPSRRGSERVSLSFCFCFSLFNDNHWYIILLFSVPVAASQMQAAAAAVAATGQPLLAPAPMHQFVPYPQAPPNYQHPYHTQMVCHCFKTVFWICLFCTWMFVLLSGFMNDQSGT